MESRSPNPNFAGWLALIAAVFVLAIAADRLSALICWIWSLDCG